MARNHWAILTEMDPALNDLITPWRTALVNDNEKLARNYRELVNVVMAGTRMEPAVMKAHIGVAEKNGATQDQVQAAMDQLPAECWEVLTQKDPEMAQVKEEYQVTHAAENEKLPRQYRELLQLAISAIRLEPAEIEKHGKAAYENGATKNEILATCEQIMTMGGFPSLRCSLMTLDTFLQEIS